MLTDERIGTSVDSEKKQTPLLRYLYFYLIDGCNLNCRHCWINPRSQVSPGAIPGVFLDFDLFKSIVQQAKPFGLRGIKLTGGEPLLHPRIVDILAFLQKEEFSVVLETNAVLCSTEFAKKLSALKNIFVSVSVDGSCSQTHDWIRQSEGSFAAAIKGIQTFVSSGIRPQIIMTIMRRNKGEIEQLIKMAEGLGIESVKFNITQPTARATTLQENGETLTIAELVSLGTWIERELSKKTSLRIVYSHPPAFQPLGKLYATTKDFCGACGVLNILGVLANGSYALCGIGQTVPELVFGHAASDRLIDVWQHNAALTALRQGLPHKLEGICQACLMKSRCRGHCIAENFSMHKNLWAGYWYCEAAYQQGLFPLSRLSPKHKNVSVSN
ncbi:MAG: SynChlorMet cassette radical SAM/SPASM protein ScmF [Candidatus Omnitrophota bacterium]